MTPRYSTDFQMVILGEGAARLFIPVSRWPQEARDRGLGAWAGVPEQSDFIPCEPESPADD